MLLWYISFRRILRDIDSKSRHALALYEQGGKEAARAFSGYLKSDFQRLEELWTQHFDRHLLATLGRHLHFGMDNGYKDILSIRSRLPVGGWHGTRQRRSV